MDRKPTVIRTCHLSGVRGKHLTTKARRPCIISSNVKNVEYNDYRMPIRETLAELGLIMIKKLKLIVKNNEKK